MKCVKTCFLHWLTGSYVWDYYYENDSDHVALNKNHVRTHCSLEDLQEECSFGWYRMMFQNHSYLQNLNSNLWICFSGHVVMLLIWWIHSVKSRTFIHFPIAVKTFLMISIKYEKLGEAVPQTNSWFRTQMISGCGCQSVSISCQWFISDWTIGHNENFNRHSKNV